MVWFGGLYVYSLFTSVKFSIWRLLCFIWVKSFHFVYFWVVMIYRVVFCQDVKYSPPIWVLLCCWVFMMLMIYSLFDVRVDVISAKFAPWNRIEIKLGLIMCFVILHKFMIDIDVYFVQFDELYICVMYLWLRIRLI